MITVLYVDDEPDLLELGKLYLEEGGTFSVMTAVSANEALELLKTRPCDAVVSDYLMPEMNGISLLRQIRSFSDIPFILFTGKGREEVVIDAINNGADFYLQKGGDPGAQFAELGHKIVQAVSRKQAEHALKRRIGMIRKTSEIATRFIRLAGSEIDAAIASILEEIGSQYRADRCYIAQVTPDNVAVAITHEWTAAGIRPVRETLGIIPLSDIPWLARRIRALDIVSIPAVARLPPGPDEIGQERSRLEDQEIRSLLLMPLAIGKRVAGALGFDAVREETDWADEDVDILMIYAQIIASALARKTADLAIEASEELYRTVFESTGTAMMILDEDKTIAVVNRELEKISGFSRQDIEGKMQWTRFVSPDDIDRMKKYHVKRRADPASVPRNYEFDFLARDGQRINAYITVEMVPGTKKSVVSIIDISRQKSAQQELLDSEEKFRSLAESLPEAIYMVQDDRYVYANPAFCQLFGYTREQVTDLVHYTEIFATTDRPRVVKAVTDRLSGVTESERYAVRGITRDGAVFPVEIHGSKTRYRGRPAIIGTITRG